MFEIVFSLFSSIFGKLFKFLFKLEFIPGVSIGMMLLFICVLGLILFLVFGLIRKD